LINPLDITYDDFDNYKAIGSSFQKGIAS